MKKRLLVIGTGVLYVLGILADTDGALNFLNRIGLSEKGIIILTGIIKTISSVGTPMLIIYLIIQLLKAEKKVDLISANFGEYKTERDAEFKVYREQKVAEFKEHKTKVNEAYNRVLSETSKLWDERGKLHNQYIEGFSKLQDQIDHIEAAKKVSEEKQLAVEHAIIGYLNSLFGTIEQERVVEALYDRLPIEEYEKIGLHEDLIKLMRINYHAAKMLENQLMLSPLQNNEGIENDLGYDGYATPRV